MNASQLRAATPEPCGGVQRGLTTARTPAAWQLSAFAGRFGEISGGHASATLTLTFRLVLEAQRRAEPVAWVGRGDCIFFPPDVAETAVDLNALVVVLTPDGRRAFRAVDRLVRSGAFGLVVLDLGQDSRVPPPIQTRFVGLAKKHDTALLCITEKNDERPSIGSLVSIRAQAVRDHKDDDHFLCRAHVLKDKRRGPGWGHTEVFHGPDGLR